MIGVDETVAVTLNAWPASITTAEEDRLTIPPPAYPPEPHPVKRPKHAIAIIHNAAVLEKIAPIREMAD
jgi:hypothetical protein